MERVTSKYTARTSLTCRMRPITRTACCRHAKTLRIEACNCGFEKAKVQLERSQPPPRMILRGNRKVRKRVIATRPRGVWKQRRVRKGSMLTLDDEYSQRRQKRQAGRSLSGPCSRANLRR